MSIVLFLALLAEVDFGDYDFDVYDFDSYYFPNLRELQKWNRRPLQVFPVQIFSFGPNYKKLEVKNQTIFDDFPNLRKLEELNRKKAFADVAPKNTEEIIKKVIQKQELERKKAEEELKQTGGGCQGGQCFRK